MGRKAVTGESSAEEIKNLSFDSPAIHVGSVTLRPRIASGLPLSREDLFAGNNSTIQKNQKVSPDLIEPDCNSSSIICNY